MQAEASKEESHRLRQQNEDLSKEIEQLKADRCADLEELVYLRWINACLRFELRNYEPGPKKTIARDLSRTLSPKSEEKAKQLIIEYASKEGFAEKGADFTDTDFDWWSSFHSYLTDSGEFDDSSIDYSSATKTETSSKARIFSKLRRLIRGKDGDHRSWSLSPERTASAGYNFSVSSGINAGTDRCSNRLRSASLGSSRIPLDIEIFGNPKVDAVKGLQGVRRNSDSDVGFPCVYKGLVSGREGVSYSLPKDQLLANPGMGQKSELVKYAEVLKESSSEGSKFHRRSATYC